MTMTIRIENELKARIAAAAQRAGKTFNAFIVDALAQTVEQAEREESFHECADERWARIRDTGQTVAWDDAKAWLEARARGDAPASPAARTLSA